MSYDITLNDPVTNEPIQIKDAHFMQGGTYQVGGCTELWLNITYNYSKFYYREDVFGENGIRTNYGMTGLESIPVLETASTEGNAKKPLIQLLTMAKMRPDGIWEGD